MKELKVILATPHPKMKNACDGAIEVYPKSDVDAAIAELKAALKESEDARYEAGADAADYYQENRKLKRALWLARSYRGRDNSILLPSKFMRKVWDSVERKCIKKAEQYK